MEVACAGIVCGETTRSGGGHRIVHTVEESHASHIVANSTADGKQEIDAPNPLRCGAQPRVHLRTNRTGGLSREHFHITSNKGGDDGDGEEHDSQAANPLRHRTPKEQAMRQNLYIVEDATARRGETGDGFEVGIGEVVDVTADEEWQ